MVEARCKKDQETIQNASDSHIAGLSKTRKACMGKVLSLSYPFVLRMKDVSAVDRIPSYHQPPDIPRTGEG